MLALEVQEDLREGLRQERKSTRNMKSYPSPKAAWVEGPNLVIAVRW